MFILEIMWDKLIHKVLDRKDRKHDSPTNQIRLKILKSGKSLKQ